MAHYGKMDGYRPMVNCLFRDVLLLVIHFGNVGGCALMMHYYNLFEYCW